MGAQGTERETAHGWMEGWNDKRELRRGKDMGGERGLIVLGHRRRNTEGTETLRVFFLFQIHRPILSRGPFGSRGWLIIARFRKVEGIDMSSLFGEWFYRLDCKKN